MKNKKLQLVFTLLFSVLFSIQSFSQYDLVKGINNDLRNMFSQITFPDTSVKILFERSAKFVDSTYYQHYNSDSILYASTWLQIYEETYYAAHDTNDFTPVDDVLQRFERRLAYSCDTIDFSIMHFNMYHVKKEALETGNYFIFDTINNVLYDHPSPIGNPYTLDSLFVAAPMKNTSFNKDVNYKISAKNIFTDSKTRGDLKENYTLQIDFGDGTGFRTINPNIDNSIYVLYPQEGTYTITTQLVHKTTNQIEYLSKSIMTIESNIACKYPDRLIRLPGMSVGVYNACTDSALPTKKIIIVEGFDPMGAYGQIKYYNKIIENQLDVMGNFGYEYYIINWNDARRDIRLNSYSLLLLIEQMKQDAQNNGDDQQFVIVGASMGGIISRYTLNYMESSHYQNDDYEPFFVEASDPYTAPFLSMHPTFPTDWQRYVNNKDRLHNCRLFISVDVPHQGAAIPIAYQYLFRQGEHVYKYINALRMSKAKMLYTFSMLDGKSPRQLLKYWVPAKVYSGFNNSQYGPNPSHASLYNQMKSFDGGEMPRFCKTIGLSDGAMDGSHNQNVHTGGPRPTNDIMLDIDYGLDVKILWIKRNLVTFKAKLKTNPELVNDEVVNIQLGRKFYSLKLFWFGVKIDHIDLPLYSLKKNIENMHSYSTGAGGTSNVLASINKTSKTHIFGKNNWQMFAGMLGWYSTGSITTNGLDVCFVPLESALDYTGGSLPWGNNLLQTGNTNLPYLLAHTPFDVIAGEVHNKENPLLDEVFNIKNFEHGDIRNENDLVYNLTGQPARGSAGALLPNGEPDENAQYAFYTCAMNSKYGAKRTWLSMEIGDEELYLENFYLPYSATYRTEYDIKVNKKNKNYKYVSFNSPDKLSGIFSKDKRFDVVNSGNALFEFDATNSPSSARGVSGQNSLTGAYRLHEEPFHICCQSSLSGRNATEWNKTPTKEYEMLVFPNPTHQTHSIFIKSQLPAHAVEVTIQLVSVLGKVIHQATVLKTMGEENFQHTVNLFDIELTTGVYILTLQAEGKLLTQKIIIQ
jgi:hypothetical protein